MRSVDMTSIVKYHARAAGDVPRPRHLASVAGLRSVSADRRGIETLEGIPIGALIIAVATAADPGTLVPRLTGALDAIGTAIVGLAARVRPGAGPRTTPGWARRRHPRHPRVAVATGCAPPRSSRPA
jgi:hypothetical protein